MPWSTSAEQSDFEEATLDFRRRSPLTHDRIADLTDRERQRAFWIAGGVELSVVQTVFDDIATSLKNGTPIEAFKASVRERLGNKFSGYHLETVFRNATQTSYNNARWHQMREPDVQRFRPYGLVDAVIDRRTSDYCRQVDGTLLALDDPWWDTHYFPAHHNCRTGVRGLSASEAKRRGITDPPPDVTPDEGFGLAPPKQPDNDNDIKPKPEKHDPDAWAIHKQKEAQALAELEEAQRAADARRQDQDPAHWFEAEYRGRYGDDAGRAVAWGRAMQERGKDVSLREARRQYDELQESLGIRLGGGPVSLFSRLDSAVADGLIEAPKTLGDAIDLLDRARLITPSLESLLNEGRALSALIGHRAAIKPAGSEVKLGAPRVSRSAPKVLKDRAGELVERVQKFWAELSDESLTLSDKRRGYIISWRAKRGQFDAASRVIYTSWALRRGQVISSGFHTVVHEMGHGLEHENPRALAAAVEFLVRRTAGESPSKMSDITGDKRYKAYEVTKKDRFFNPYMGKDYLRSDGSRFATEITSMALEALHRNAGKLVGEDVESFWLALGQLAGDKAR